ncbi:hypothetical protein HPB48_027024 [Haemaphysalis longicornis]|uniref:Uncharacterized protein n=1 Tax=Haemaphysalis longicornis TaxID=44386 RepID=A0A9J6HCA3_HAELO|nr:hypothetical protein HPB48_027024 [Haemaphysalis longicornis]
MIKSEVEKIESARHLVRKPQTVPHMWLGTSYVAMVAVSTTQIRLQFGTRQYNKLEPVTPPIQDSTNPHLRQIGRVVRERRTAVPVSVLYGERLLRRVTQGDAAIISDGTSLTFQVTSVCRGFVGAEFYFAREGVVSHPLNSFARKDIDPLVLGDINRVYVCQAARVRNNNKKRCP